MKKYLIIEDEVHIGLYLKNILREENQNIDINGPLTSVSEVVNELAQNNDYDLIFADIRLTDGDVFEAFQCIKPNSFVIFTTAYNEYAMQAIKNNGLDYLMKPIDPSELRKAINKLELAPTTEKQHIKCMLDKIFAETQTYRERFLINKGDCFKTLFANDINYIYKDDTGIHAFANDGITYKLQQTMNELEQELNPKYFFRLNRQYIANIRGIVQLNMFFDSKLIAKLKGCNDDHIIISKEKSALLKKWLDK